MSMQTNALVLKVTDIGESDKVITLLTADYGVIRAFANRAKKLNSKMQAATQTLCYGEFSIYQGKDAFVIDGANAKEVFFGLREDIELLALGQYFCSIAIELIPEGESAGEPLRVILNSLAYLQEGKRSPQLLKAVTELKLACLAGYSPDVFACSSCGEEPKGDVKFSPQQGVFYCRACHGQGELITPGVLCAIRHISLNDVNRIFSFALSPKDEKILGKICEQYLLCQTGKSFKALDFYKSTSKLQ